jgi:hypothetical protein
MNYIGYTIQNYIKIIGFVMSWPVTVSEFRIEMLNIGRKIVRIVEVKIFICVKTGQDITNPVIFIQFYINFVLCNLCMS